MSAQRILHLPSIIIGVFVGWAFTTMLFTIALKDIGLMQ